ncbi:MAG: methyltransferase domain-containing protein [Patescibacteria group bacterium]
MSEYAPQVDSSHYSRGVYRAKERWVSYWHQLDLVRRANPRSVLEIGPGLGIVTDALRKDGIEVITCDIAVDLKPDVVGSVTALPFRDAQFDLALAAEILEHIRWEDVPVSLGELARVAGQTVVISLPHPGYVFLFACKLPLLPRFEWSFQIPFFWKEHTFNGEHYWELGKQGYSVERFVTAAKAAGLQLVSTHKYADDPVHQLFVFSK